jgi:hypothetical protein
MLLNRNALLSPRKHITIAGLEPIRVSFFFFLSRFLSFPDFSD